MVATLVKNTKMVCATKESLQFFKSASEADADLTEYQKVTISALTICCTCD
ncbi:MAG: hypothetical protein PHO56_00980 [Patescibacteria group bacterium]|jgi:hypothetical protein|nr:hypothetical protein [Patescibacteria group bacterium]